MVAESADYHTASRSVLFAASVENGSAIELILASTRSTARVTSSKS